MKKELDDLLCSKYPKIFAERHADPLQTAMCWGFACGDGWYPLIDNLCSQIQFHLEHNAKKILRNLWLCKSRKSLAA